MKRRAKPVLILLAHGSRDPRWRRPFKKLEQSLLKTYGAERVLLSYMEFCGPSFDAAVARAVANGARAINILPLFMAGGGHLTRDIAPMMAAARKKCRNVRFKNLGAIGEHPKFFRLMREVVGSCL